MGAEILGLVFLGVTYAILVPVLIRRIDSGAIITVVCVLLFVPLFVASFWLADVLTGFDSGKEREKKREEEEQRRQARHRDRREGVSRSSRSCRSKQRRLLHPYHPPTSAQHPRVLVYMVSSLIVEHVSHELQQHSGALAGDDVHDTSS